jgi:hypothetical protein
MEIDRRQTDSGAARVVIPWPTGNAQRNGISGVRVEISAAQIVEDWVTAAVLAIAAAWEIAEALVTVVVLAIVVAWGIAEASATGFRIAAAPE